MSDEKRRNQSAMHLLESQIRGVVLADRMSVVFADAGKEGLTNVMDTTCSCKAYSSCLTVNPLPG